MSDLIDKEAVQREIQNSFNAGAFRWQDCQDLMDRINALPAAQRWVRCEEELPKEDGAYAVGWLYPSGCFYWCKLLFLNGEWQVVDVPEPDYWMPIEPPKEDA